MLQSLGVDRTKIAVELEQPSPESDNVQARPLPLAKELRRVVEAAIERRIAMHHENAGTEHLLIGITDCVNCSAAQMLVDLGVSTEDVRSKTLDVLRIQ